MPDISSSLSKREVNARQNTYTKSEIDLKDGAIQAIAEAAQTTADAAEKKNQEQDQLIAELQKSSHSHSNQDVLDKTEQPYTTAERDKLAGLENYTHPTHTAHAKGFYKFASDGEGHVTDAEEVTASDLYNAGGVIKNYLNFADYTGHMPIAFMSAGTSGSFGDYAKFIVDTRETSVLKIFMLSIGENGIEGSLMLNGKNGSECVIFPNSNSSKPSRFHFFLPDKSGTFALTGDIPDISGKQDKLTAGTNITIIGGTINAKDTTYGNASASVAGLMSAADKSKLDKIIEPTRYLRYSATGGMVKDTWYKFASFNCTQHYNYSTAIFAAGFRYNVMRLFRITAGNAQGKPVASRISISNITGDLRGIVGYIINGNTVNFFLKPATGMYGYVARIGATAETGDFITQTDLVAATTAEAASIVPFTAAGTDVAFSNHSNETDKISNGTLRSGFYVNAAANSTSGYTWFRMATCKISGAYETVNTTFLITNGMTGQGLLSCGIRNGSTGKTVESCTLVFSARNGSGVPPGMFRIVAINSDTGVTYELWGQITARWFGVRYTVLDERNISGGKYNNWKLESHSDADAKTAPTTGNYYVNSIDTSIATTLTDSGWVAMTVEGYAKSGTVKYRTYGNQITITGSVVLKNDIATSYPAPQYIASTIFDFSKIVGCSGVGRSSSGVGAYVAVENYNGDNLVCVYALGSKIAAGATLYFTITGFID